MKKQTINSNNKSIMHRQAPAAWLGGCLLSLGLVWAPPTLAAEVTCGAAPDIEAAGMNCFNPNTAAKSGEVNANFKYLLDEKNSLQQAVNTLQSDNANLQQAISTLQSDNANLQQSNTDLLQRVAALEAKLTPVTYNDNQKKLLIEGVNVQIVNGAGTTDSTNSTGNLIIGYNEAATSEICSIGPYLEQADCEANGGTWAANQRQGSHNVVIGDQHQYTRYGGFVTGFRNVINGKIASVSGGTNNTASGYAASVSGGGGNTANGDRASVSGGAWNKANGEDASVSGGERNTASGASANVSSGYKNTASILGANVSGGSNNKADGRYSSILGGQNIEISNDYQTYPNP